MNTNNYLSPKINIKNATDRLKGIFLSLVCTQQGFFIKTICILSRAKQYIAIYDSIVLANALYGFGNWCNLTESEILSLERAQRFCIKHMQSLSTCTRTDDALSVFSVFPIEVEIEFRKLTHFGQMCRLNSNTCIWVKNVFLNRLTSYTTYSNSRQSGIYFSAYSFC